MDAPARSGSRRAALSWLARLVALGSLAVSPLAAISGNAGGAPVRPLLHTRATTQLPVARLVSTPGYRNDEFGYSVAVSGDTLVVGSPWHETQGKIVGPGAAWVFTYQAGAWRQVAELTAPDGADQDAFGWSVAISGDTIAVGAPYHYTKSKVKGSHGAIYVYSDTSGAWRNTAELSVSDPNSIGDYQLGVSVALQGNTLVAGDPVGSSAGTGAVYVFTRTAARWSQSAEFTATKGDTQLGYSVAISGDTIAAGAPGAAQSGVQGASPGAVDVYTYDPGLAAWKQCARLTGVTAAGSNFGEALALAGQTLVVGAPTNADTNAGAVDVFQASGATWSAPTQLAAPSGAHRFGSAVAISNSTIYVATNFATDGLKSTGRVVVYRDEGGYVASSALTSADGEVGSSLAVSGATVVVGAKYREVDANLDQGAAYVYGGPATLSVAFGAFSTVSMGKTEDIAVTVSAGSADLSSLSFGSGLDVSTQQAEVVSQAADSSGFSLAAGQSRSFVFKVKGVSKGKPLMSVHVTGLSGGASASASATAVLEVGEVRFLVWRLTPPTEENNNDFIDLDYKGFSFDPSGGPISLSFSGTPAGQIPAATNFEGDLKIARWPHRVTVTGALSSSLANGYCWGVVAARQGDLVVDVKVTGRPSGWILWSGSKGVVNSHEAWCQGEDVTIFEHLPLPIVVFGTFTRNTAAGRDGIRVYGFNGANTASPLIPIHVGGILQLELAAPYHLCVAVALSRSAVLSTGVFRGTCAKPDWTS